MACCEACAQTGKTCADLPSPSVANPWPRTTQVLADYAKSQASQGRPFFISAHFNSGVLDKPSGFGFFVIDDIIAAASAVAGAVGAVAGPAAEIASVVNTVKGQATASSKGSGVTADQIAAAILPNVQAQLQAKGISLPASVAQQTVAASILDSFGPQYHNIVLYAGLGLGALLLFKLIKG